MSISIKVRSSSSLTSYSKDTLVFEVAFANYLTKIVLLSFRFLGSSFLKTSALCNMILVSTFKPTTSSFKILAKSSDSFSGFTTFTLPFVYSTTLDKIYSFELSPFIVTMFIPTFFYFADKATSS